MRILALDTSSMMGSVAVADEEKVIAEELLNIEVTHSERLIPSVDAVLEKAGISISGVDGFGVAIGPGSFTGLRIGIAAVKGFAFCTRRPVVGISSLAALAYNLCGSEKPVISVLDARRGEIYVGVYVFEGDDARAILPDTVMKPEKVIEYAASLGKRVTFVGDGIGRLRPLIEKQLRGAVIPPPGINHPRASNIAWLALKRIAAGNADDLVALNPNYIRKSDAELLTPAL